MLIGIDASRSVETIQKTGVEVVSNALLTEIQNSKFKIKNFGVDFIFYAPQKIYWLPEEKQRVFGPKRLWTVLGLSWQMLRHKPEVLFVPVHTLPFFCPEKTYKVIHDIAFRFEPRAYGFWQRAYLNFDLWRCRRICKKVIVPTEKVKDDLVRVAGFEEKKVEVVRWGYKKIKNQKSKIKIKEDLYDNSQERKKQIVYVGRIEEKKNIINLIRAFEIFNKDYPEYKLILAGKEGVGYENIKYQMSNAKGKIDYLGYVTDEEKYKLLSESMALALVSKEEGFGVPILEAFDFELPTVAADIPVLREIGGEACVYVDPNNAEDIEQGLKQAVSDHNLRNKLVNSGKERLGQFGWEKCAQRFLEVILSD